MRHGLNSLRSIAALVILAFAASPAYPDPNIPFVSIGQLDWMSLNVDTAKFQNGDAVPIIEDAGAWAEAGKSSRPAMTFYSGAGKIPSEWGRLYNYAAIMDARGLCPVGWRVPDDGDWAELESDLGLPSAGRRLRSRSGWPPGGEGSDTIGFEAFPAGFRTQRGDYFLANRVAYFWSATEVSPTETTAHMLFDYDDKIFRIIYNKAMGMSLRCVRKS